MNDLKGLFFIFFDSRSGSTYLANMLSRNPDVAIPPESNFLPRIISSFPQETFNDSRELTLFLDIIFSEKKFIDWGLKKDELFKKMSKIMPISTSKAIMSVCQEFRDVNAKDAQLFGLKKGYIKYYKKIIALFPDAKIIGLIRDGRAVFNSKKKSIYSKTKRPFETNPYKAGIKWVGVTRKLRHIKRELPDQTLIIHYEEMVKDERNILKKISAFLGLGMRANLNNDNKYEIPGRYGNIHSNIKKPPIKERISAWQKELVEEEIFAFESMAFTELLQEGYEPVFSKKDLNNTIKRGGCRLKLLQKNLFRPFN